MKKNKKILDPRLLCQLFRDTAHFFYSQRFAFFLSSCSIRLKIIIYTILLIQYELFHYEKYRPECALVIYAYFQQKKILKGHLLQRVYTDNRWTVRADLFFFFVIINHRRKEKEKHTVENKKIKRYTRLLYEFSLFIVVQVAVRHLHFVHWRDRFVKTSP